MISLFKRYPRMRRVTPPLWIYAIALLINAWWITVAYIVIHFVIKCW